MKFSLKWLSQYTDLPINDKDKLNDIIDRIALQIVDVDERWFIEKDGKIIDAIIDIDNKIITNRPYAFGHRGLAREISIMLNQKYTGNIYPKFAQSNSNILPVEVQVIDPDLCPRFTVIAIKGVKIGPSPEFLKNEVESVGLRSINNLVDITNLIMLDTAQPVHAYDYSKVKDGKFIIRRAKEKEEIITLDGVKRNLNQEILLITDPEKAIGIGGVMGALNSEIDETTTDIILEVASFQPRNIRLTAKNLKHRTDAVTRFEKGIDPTNIPNVMAYMVELVLQNCGGEIASEYIDVSNIEKSTIRTTNLKMDFNPERVNKLLGFNITNDFIKKVFEGFEINVEEKNVNLWSLEIPPYRPDIKEPADLIEDIGRMYGYQNIPNVTPINQLIIPNVNNKIVVRKHIREVLNASGLDEVITYSMISQKESSEFSYNSEAIRIVNPLSEDYLFLRNSLLASLTKVTSLNAKYFDDFGIFEISRRFTKKDGIQLDYEKDKGESMQPVETEVLALMYYSKETKQNSIYKLKGAIEQLLGKLGIDNFEILSSGELKINKINSGKFGLLTKNQLDQFGLSNNVSFVEIELQQIYELFKETKSYKPYSKFQNSKLNWSIVIPEKSNAGEILQALKQINNPLIKSVDFITVYRNEKDMPGKKSVSIELIIQKDDGNIIDEEIYEISDLVESKIKALHSAEIKGGGVQRKEKKNIRKIK